MTSRVRTGLETWAAAAASSSNQGGKKGRKGKGVGRFGLRYIDSPSAGLRYKIIS